MGHDPIYEGSEVTGLNIAQREEGSSAGEPNKPEKDLPARITGNSRSGEDFPI